jgi:hypothetical protein
VLDAVDDVLRHYRGVATRAALLRAVTRNQLDHEIRSGRLTSPFARAWCRPWDADAVLDRAALTSVGPPAALSHTTALRRWTLLDDALDDVHVIAPARRYPRSQSGLTVHRLARFPPLMRSDGLLTVAPAAAAVMSWPLLAPDRRRAPLIDGTRRKLILPADLQTAVERAPHMPGRAELVELIGLIEAGCESELEIWGLLHVFDAPGLRHGVRQHWLQTRVGAVRVDLAYVGERVAVELDGWGSHSSREQREKDMRRDAALAALGWITVRFSYRRLHDDVAGCRRDLLATLAARR